MFERVETYGEYTAVFILKWYTIERILTEIIMRGEQTGKEFVVSLGL